ncbi:MAG: ABC transporter ATP-binding protein [Peptostreptococcaceae bacterium]|nr:ABC transporter ATP-binding protein [Peptostreptococcaceae bacterium]
MNILRTEGLTKIYGTGDRRVTALNNVDLSVDRGDFLSIVGSSGSGKSTLLHLIGGVDRPTSGKIFLEGTDISTYTEKELALFRRRKVGLVYQFYNLIPSLSVKHNILLPLTLDHRKAEQDFFEELIERLCLKEKLNAFPSELSGGQQQRVAIARSLIYRPAILLADEPTGNLDRKNSCEIMDLLRFSNKNYDQTILLITHDETLALGSDRVVTLEDGQIIGDEYYE